MSVGTEFEGLLGALKKKQTREAEEKGVRADIQREREVLGLHILPEWQGAPTSAETKSPVKAQTSLYDNRFL